MDNKKNVQQLLERFIAGERSTVSNPFLVTRIMAVIEKRGSEQLVMMSPVWRTALVAVSLLIAVFTGLATGSLYQTNNETPEMVLMNDDRMENFGLYYQMGKE